MICAICDWCGKRLRCRLKKGYMALYHPPGTWLTTALGDFCNLTCWHKAYYQTHIGPNIEAGSQRKEPNHHAITNAIRTRAA